MPVIISGITHTDIMAAILKILDRYNTETSGIPNLLNSPTDNILKRVERRLDAEVEAYVSGVEAKSNHITRVTLPAYVNNMMTRLDTEFRGYLEDVDSEDDVKELWAYYTGMLATMRPRVEREIAEPVASNTSNRIGRIREFHRTTKLGMLAKYRRTLEIAKKVVFEMDLKNEVRNYVESDIQERIAQVVRSQITYPVLKRFGEGELSMDDVVQDRFVVAKKIREDTDKEINFRVSNGHIPNILRNNASGVYLKRFQSVLTDKVMNETQKRNVQALAKKRYERVKKALEESIKTASFSAPKLLLLASDYYRSVLPEVRNYFAALLIEFSGVLRRARLEGTQTCVVQFYNMRSVMVYNFFFAMCEEESFDLEKTRARFHAFYSSEIAKARAKMISLARMPYINFLNDDSFEFLQSLSELLFFTDETLRETMDELTSAFHDTLADSIGTCLDLGIEDVFKEEQKDSRTAVMDTFAQFEGNMRVFEVSSVVDEFVAILYGEISHQIEFITGHMKDLVDSFKVETTQPYNEEFFTKTQRSFLKAGGEIDYDGMKRYVILHMNAHGDSVVESYAQLLEDFVEAKIVPVGELMQRLLGPAILAEEAKTIFEAHVKIFVNLENKQREIVSNVIGQALREEAVNIVADYNTISYAARQSIVRGNLKVLSNKAVLEYERARSAALWKAASAYSRASMQFRVRYTKLANEHVQKFNDVYAKELSGAYARTSDIRSVVTGILQTLEGELRDDFTENHREIAQGVLAGPANVMPEINNNSVCYPPGLIGLAKPREGDLPSTMSPHLIVEYAQEEGQPLHDELVVAEDASQMLGTTAVAPVVVDDTYYSRIELALSHYDSWKDNIIDEIIAAVEAEMAQELRNNTCPNRPKCGDGTFDCEEANRSCREGYVLFTNSHDVLCCRFDPPAAGFPYEERGKLIAIEMAWALFTDPGGIAFMAKVSRSLAVKMGTNVAKAGRSLKVMAKFSSKLSGAVAKVNGRIAEKAASKTGFKLGTKVGVKMAKKLGMKLGTKVAMAIGKTLLKGAAKVAVSGPVGLAMLAFDLMSLALDLWDPAGYNDVQAAGQIKSMRDDILSHYTRELTNEGITNPLVTDPLFTENRVIDWFTSNISAFLSSAEKRWETMPNSEATAEYENEVARLEGIMDSNVNFVQEMINQNTENTFLVKSSKITNTPSHLVGTERDHDYDQKTKTHLMVCSLNAAGIVAFNSFHVQKAKFMNEIKSKPIYRWMNVVNGYRVYESVSAEDQVRIVSGAKIKRIGWAFTKVDPDEEFWMQYRYAKEEGIRGMPHRENYMGAWNKDAKTRGEAYTNTITAVMSENITTYAPQGVAAATVEMVRKQTADSPDWYPVYDDLYSEAKSIVDDNIAELVEEERLAVVASEKALKKSLDAADRKVASENNISLAEATQKRKEAEGEAARQPLQPDFAIFKDGFGQMSPLLSVKQQCDEMGYDNHFLTDKGVVVRGPGAPRKAGRVGKFSNSVNNSSASNSTGLATKLGELELFANATSTRSSTNETNLVMLNDELDRLNNFTTEEIPKVRKRIAKAEESMETNASGIETLSARAGDLESGVSTADNRIDAVVALASAIESSLNATKTSVAQSAGSIEQVPTSLTALTQGVDKLGDALELVDGNEEETRKNLADLNRDWNVLKSKAYITNGIFNAINLTATKRKLALDAHNGQTSALHFAGIGNPNWAMYCSSASGKGPDGKKCSGHGEVTHNAVRMRLDGDKRNGFIVENDKNISVSAQGTRMGSGRIADIITGKWTGFGFHSRTGSSRCAISQTDRGDTILNAALGQKLSLRVANVETAKVAGRVGKFSNSVNNSSASNSTGLATKLGELELFANATSTRSSTNETDLIMLNDELDRLNNFTTEEIPKVRERIAKAEESMKTNASGIETLSTRAGDLESGVSTADNRIDAVVGLASAIESSLKATKTSVAQSAGAIEQVSTSLTQLTQGEDKLVDAIELVDGNEEETRKNLADLNRDWNVLKSRAYVRNGTLNAVGLRATNCNLSLLPHNGQASAIHFGAITVPNFTMYLSNPTGKAPDGKKCNAHGDVTHHAVRLKLDGDKKSGFIVKNDKNMGVFSVNTEGNTRMGAGVEPY
ncbi:unnamed protein product [Ectocarpus sp. CCAP 1310/34]|nr:unnamed protein product [Ectocarpus sp. CCAP 1310/34]